MPVTKDVKQVMERDAQAQQELEKIRVEWRQARAEFIETLLCDGKDVLSPAEMEGINLKLAALWEVQKRLGHAFFEHAGTFAEVCASCLGDSAEADL